MKKICFIVCLGVLCLVSTAKAMVNIAVIAPKNGNASAYTQELFDGVKTAVAEINAGGGLLGKSINLLEVDDPCDNRFNVSMAQMLSVNASAEDKVSLVIGPYCKNEFALSAAIYAKGKILQIVPHPVDNAVMNVRQKGLFKLVGAEAAQAQAFGEYYQQNLSGQNVALVYLPEMRSAVDVAAAVQKEFAAKGWDKYLTVYNFFATENDYVRMAREIVAQNKVVYLLGKSKDVAKLTREIGKITKDAVVFANKYQLDDAYPKIVPAGQKNVYLLELATLKDNPKFAETLVRLRLRGKEPKGLGVYGYLSVNLWKNLVTAAQTFDYEKITQKSASVRWGLPWGDLRFEQGNPDKSAAYDVSEYQNGF